MKYCYYYKYDKNCKTFEIATRFEKNKDTHKRKIIDKQRDEDTS